MQAHPQSKRLIVTSAIVLLAWMCLFWMFFLVLAGSQKWFSVDETIFFNTVGVLAITIILATILASSIKCLNCGKHILKQTFEKKHPDAVRHMPLNYWSSIVVDCLFKKKITCMYCGKVYETRW